MTCPRSGELSLLACGVAAAWAERKGSLLLLLLPLVANVFPRSQRDRDEGASIAMETSPQHEQAALPAHCAAPLTGADAGSAAGPC